MLGGNGRGPLRVPIALDMLLIDDKVSRQVTATAIRRNASDLSRFVEAPLAFNPVALDQPQTQTIPVGGAPAVLKETVPGNLDLAGATVGR
jgi:hypothetical protein